MNADASDLIRRALALPAAARAALAGKLIVSLDGVVDADAEESWSREIERREEELTQRRVRPIPWHEVRRRMISG